MRTESDKRTVYKTDCSDSISLKNAYKEGKEILAKAGITEADLDAWYLLEFVTGITKARYYMDPDQSMDPEAWEKYKEYLEKRRNHIPLQHITGSQEFMGLEFLVNEHVLIPRQDTEVLVEEALEIMKQEIFRSKGCLQLLDMCTGSGCILLSVMHYAEQKGIFIEGTGVDFSEQALMVAQKNEKHLRSTKKDENGKVNWILSDLFENVNETYDMILSNPPYIRTAEIEKLQDEVKLHDPFSALDGKEDGLYFYRKIVTDAKQFLKTGGILAFEIGYDQGKEVSTIKKIKKIKNRRGYRTMFDRLEDLVIRYQEVMGELQEPDVANDPERFRKLMKEQSDLAPIVEAYQEYKNCKQNVEESLMILEEESDEEMRELAKEELNESKARIEELEQELKILLLPKDPNDDKNVIVEIRAGAGGDEAALFAAEVYRMYVHYADSRRWKTEMISLNENGIGGFKECVFMITGQGAYSRMKYESGVHRVQRVPETESGGRIHTSTITVAVMPEAEEVDVVIDEKDIRIDVMRASGNGGQCVNTTDSAVRLTHYPTGIVIYSQTEKSQLQNKEKAFRLLRSKLYDLELEKKQASEAAERRSQIGTGDRSEKIRTYNFPQGRVTDHRIKLTLHKLDSILNGDLDEVIDSLIAADQTAKLAKMEE